MNVATATWAAPSASAIMTARNGGIIVDTGADTGIPASTGTVPSAVQPVSGNATGEQGQGSKDDPLVNRYPRIGVSFNNEASRLIILFRDPATGQAIDQIPSEVALKQYIEAQQKERAATPSYYDATVGGKDGTDATSSGKGTAETTSGGSSKTDTNSGTHAASVRLAAVNGTLTSTPSAKATAAPPASAPGRTTGQATGIDLKI